MISLYTPDGRMVSHRKKIEDNHIRDGLMISTHTPFSNDAATKIKTYLLPLKNGWHLRVHKVSLSQPYIVCEGGYSVGIRDDGFKTFENSVVYGNIKSQIIVKSEVETKYDIHRIHPGMHLLQPQAMYPVYKTEILPKGEYIFATLVCFTTDGREHTMPDVKIDGENISLNQNGKIINIKVE